MDIDERQMGRGREATAVTRLGVVLEEDEESSVRWQSFYAYSRSSRSAGPPERSCEPDKVTL
jgi:hypothetical protein